MQKEVVGHETEKDTDADELDESNWSAADHVVPLKV
jgi:hypothetical protein